MKWSNCGIDNWWSRHTRRYDRGPVYVSVMISVVCYAISASITGPVPGSPINPILSPLTQDMMSMCILIGGSLCLLGTSVGSKHFFPKVSLKRAYTLGVIGVPMLAVGLVVYGVALTLGYSSFTAALGGVLGPLIAVGDIVQAFFLFLEIRRINRNIPLVVAVESSNPLEPLPPDPTAGCPPVPAKDGE